MVHGQDISPSLETVRFEMKGVYTLIDVLVLSTQENRVTWGSQGAPYVRSPSIVWWASEILKDPGHREKINTTIIGYFTQNTAEINRIHPLGWISML